MPDQVLIVEDDAALRELMTLHLRRAGYAVDQAVDARSAVSQLAEVRYRLVLLDLGLPDFDGITVCRRLRQLRMNCEVPVLAVSARRLESDVVLALESGADAFMAKPFTIDELLWRVRTLLRRGRAEAPATAPPAALLRVRHLTLDSERRQAMLAGTPVHLTRREFDLLAHLARHSGRVLSHRALAARGWGPGAEVSDRAVHIVLSRLRRKIERDASHPPLIRTIRGEGYSLA